MVNMGLVIPGDQKIGFIAFVSYSKKKVKS
jgi:hypothetical protein